MSDAVIGHNSVAGKELKALADRIVRLEEEKQTISDDIKDVYAEVKGKGFDVKVARRLVSYLKQDPTKRRAILDENELFDLYLHALSSEELLS